jgi:uncharacterized membrane protein YphA (DoxX/SURF4 family)
MSVVTPGLALLPLRIFLGVTLAYAGIHKLSDAGFLHAGSETYIGDQLEAFADGTPGGFLLETFALPAPVPAGIGVAWPRWRSACWPSPAGSRARPRSPASASVSCCS